MRRFADFLRIAVTAPEVLGLLFTVALGRVWPEPIDFAAAQMLLDLKWTFGAAAVPLGLLGATYVLGTEILSPKGRRDVLLEWPNYWMLKNRVLMALGFCVFGFVVSLIGFYVLAARTQAFGVTLLIAGCVSSGLALATVALARWRSRELLGE